MAILEGAETAPILALKGIRKIAKAGVWRDFTSKDGTVEFKKKNLIYGFNGSGKTTLSRIFSSVLYEKLDPKLPPGCTFEIELSDGTVIFSNDVKNLFGKNLLVFNTDFVANNIVWADGSTNPIFHISKENAQAAENFAKAELSYTDLKNQKDQAKIKAKNDSDTFTQFKTDTARRVRDMYGVMRTQTYNATHLASDYEKSNYEQNVVLEKSVIGLLQRSVQSSEPLPKIQLSLNVDLTLPTRLSEVKQKLTETPGSHFSGLLATHAAMHTWVHDGLQYHAKENLKECLFCGSELKDARITELTKEFNTGWATFQKDIVTLSEGTSETHQSLRNLYSELPKPPEIHEAQRKEYQAIRDRLIEQVILAGTAVKFAVSLLKEKQEKPNESFEVPDEINTFVSSNWSTETKELIEKLSGIFSLHNKSFDDHLKEQREAAYKLKSHVLSSEKSRYALLLSNAQTSETNSSGLDTKVAAAQKEYDEAANQVRGQNVALAALNHFLRDYLGHEDVKLRAKENGYELIRPDGSSAQNLSEGEKTAIAFCFFLTLLSADDRNKKELVVIIDDPISSLDSSCMTHAFALIKRHTRECAQVVISTHNITFMQMVKRLFGSTMGVLGVPNFQLLYLMCTCPAGKFENRHTTLVVMPALISKYDSEYHYLFALTYNAAKNADCPELFLLPNAIRKMLEIFLAFAAPAQSDFATALSDVSKINGITREEIGSLERLIQIESHGGLSAATSFSALTVEEASHAASAAMRYIESRDKGHYNEMKKLVSA